MPMQLPSDAAAEVILALRVMRLAEAVANGQSGTLTAERPCRPPTINHKKYT
jgi:hypothetical protein